MENLTPLQNFGFLAVTGLDANKFLQGYTTCDLNDLTTDNNLPGALCNLKGRMLCNFRVAKIDNGYLLRMHKDLVAATLSFLKKYVVFSKAELTDMTGSWQSYGITQSSPGFPQQVNAMTHFPEGFVTHLIDARWELWTQQSLPATGSLTAWHLADIKAGVAWVEPATSEGFIPQMFNLADQGGVSFTKGCYLGQEIVARMQYRGELKRRLHRGEANRDVQVGESLLDADGKPAGIVVTAQASQFLAVLQNHAIGELALAFEDGSQASARLIVTTPAGQAAGQGAE